MKAQLEMATAAAQKETEAASAAIAAAADASQKQSLDELRAQLEREKEEAVAAALAAAKPSGPTAEQARAREGGGLRAGRARRVTGGFHALLAAMSHTLFVTPASIAYPPPHHHHHLTHTHKLHLAARRLWLTCGLWPHSWKWRRSWRRSS